MTATNKKRGNPNPRPTPNPIAAESELDGDGLEAVETDAGSTCNLHKFADTTATSHSSPFAGTRVQLVGPKQKIFAGQLHANDSGAAAFVYLHSVPGVHKDSFALRPELELMLSIGKACMITIEVSVIELKRVTAEIAIAFAVLTLSDLKVKTLIAKFDE
jgi:hypothetical protein